MENNNSEQESFEVRKKRFMECVDRLDKIEERRKKNLKNEEDFCKLLIYEINNELFSYFPELTIQEVILNNQIKDDLLNSGKDAFYEICMIFYKDQRYYEKLWEEDAKLFRKNAKILTDMEIEEESIKSAEKLRNQVGHDKMSDYDFNWIKQNSMIDYKNQRYFKIFIHKLYKIFKKCTVEIIREIVNFEPNELRRLDACLFIEAKYCYERLMKTLNGKLKNPFSCPKYCEDEASTIS